MEAKTNEQCEKISHGQTDWKESLPVTVGESPSFPRTSTGRLKTEIKPLKTKKTQKWVEKSKFVNENLRYDRMAVYTARFESGNLRGRWLPQRRYHQNLQVAAGRHPLNFLLLYIPKKIYSNKNESEITCRKFVIQIIQFVDIKLSIALFPIK